MKEARRGMFGYELQGLEHSDPGFFGWKIWKLELDLSEGLGVGLGLTIELGLVVDCWNPDKGNKVSVKVFIKGLESPKVDWIPARGQGSGSCWHPRIPWLCSAMGQGGSCDLGHWLLGGIPSKTSRYWHRCDEGALGT